MNQKMEDEMVGQCIVKTADINYINTEKFSQAHLEMCLCPLHKIHYIVKLCNNSQSEHVFITKYGGPFR